MNMRYIHVAWSDNSWDTFTVGENNVQSIYCSVDGALIKFTNTKRVRTLNFHTSQFVEYEEIES